MSLIDQVRSRRRKALVSGTIAAMLAFVLLLSVSVVALPWAIVICVFVYLRMVRTDKLVVWLRRFHKNEPKRLRFSMLLNRACPGFCIPITIQDSAFKTSYFSSGARLFILAPLIFGLGSLLYLLCTVTIGLLLSAVGISDQSAFVIGSVVSLGPIISYAYNVKNYLARRGHAVLDAERAMATAEAVLHRAKQQKSAFSGVLILRCVDEVWRDAVRFLLSKADAVIIDVSELTENLMWELETACENRRIDSMLITCGVSPDAPEELPKPVHQKLESVLGRERLSRLHVFFYPMEQPPPGLARGRLYTRLSKELESQLGTCIEFSEA